VQRRAQRLELVAERADQRLGRATGGVDDEVAQADAGVAQNLLDAQAAVLVGALQAGEGVVADQRGVGGAQVVVEQREDVGGAGDLGLVEDPALDARLDRASCSAGPAAASAARDARRTTMIRSTSLRPAT